MIDINLIASRRAARQRSLALMRLAIYGLCGLALAIVLVFAWMTVQISFVNSRIIEAQAILSAPDMQKNLERITFLEEEISVLGPKVRVLKKVHESEDRWLEVLHDVGRSIPADVAVESVSSRAVDKGQQINLKGHAGMQDLIGAYMLSLQGEDWAGPIQLVQAASHRNRTLGRVEYELTIPLNEPIGVDLLVRKPESSPAAPGEADDIGGE